MSDHISATPLDWSHVTTVISYTAGYPTRLIYDGNKLRVQNTQTHYELSWTIYIDSSGLTLEWDKDPLIPLKASDLLSTLEGVFTFHPQHSNCRINKTEVTLWPEELIQAGVLQVSQDTLFAYREALWQQPILWLPKAQPPRALHYSLTAGQRHPQRPPKPQGVLYQRYIPWLGKTFSFRALQLDEDLVRVNRWMNEPAVAQVWQEEGDLNKHRDYLTAIEEDPHIYSMIACLDDEPFGYFEAYWAKENRIAPFYEANDYDRGWHVLIGEPAFRGKSFATAWLTSISHYLFLNDVRTQRIVGEPRIDHIQQIRNLDRSGYAKVKEFDFPHKRAQLVMLLREQFFANALWWPRIDASN